MLWTFLTPWTKLSVSYTFYTEKILLPVSLSLSTLSDWLSSVNAHSVNFTFAHMPEQPQYRHNVAIHIKAIKVKKKKNSIYVNKHKGMQTVITNAL